MSGPSGGTPGALEPEVPGPAVGRVDSSAGGSGPDREGRNRLARRRTSI
jgi:hypothetical protein